VKRLGLAAGALVVAGAVVLALVLARDAEPATNPHAGVGTLSAREESRILSAVETAATAQSRDALVAEGRRLFRSAQLARDGESCQSCHLEGGGTNADIGTIVHPQVEGDFEGPRDVPSLWGVADTPPYGWDGQEDSLPAFVAGTIRSHFKDPGVRRAERTAAITAYLETLAPPVTGFDQGVMSDAARRGEELFQGKGGCIECHAGPLLTDNALHNTLVPKVAPGDDDPGAAPRGPLAGAFNTPHLRDVRNTGPYMHNGSLKTLRDVVEFYDDDSSVAPLRLTGAEVDDLVAYLETL
jgi:cytochrome c peroxidase